jgi:hypothetical protein
MFREMHHADRNFRAMDLAAKIAERSRQSLAATNKSSRRATLNTSGFSMPRKVVAR